MKISCVQMDMLLAQPEANFQRAEELILQALADTPDVVVLPECWNLGIYYGEDLKQLCDREGQRTKAFLGAMAAKYRVNIVSGSIYDLRDGLVYNTALVFDRTGACVASYDKTHLFTHGGEHLYCTPGDHLCRFTLDGVDCGIVICYDIRFPELARSMALEGMDILFVPAQWPKSRIELLTALAVARAVENQMYVVSCNSGAPSEKSHRGGHSAIVDPLGMVLAEAGEQEEIISASCDLSVINNIRTSINVFADRRPDLYKL